MTSTPTAIAALVSAQLVNQVNNVAKAHIKAKANGGSVQGITFTAAEYAEVSGTANMAILDAIVAANPQS